MARRKWPTPAGRVLPVMISETSFETIPPYLKAVTVLHPKGSVAAEVAAEVEALRPKWSILWRGNVSVWKRIAILAVAVALAAVLCRTGTEGYQIWSDREDKGGQALEAWLYPNGVLSQNRMSKLQAWLNERYPDSKVPVAVFLDARRARPYVEIRKAALQDDELMSEAK